MPFAISVELMFGGRMSDSRTPMTNESSSVKQSSSEGQCLHIWQSTSVKEGTPENPIEQSYSLRQHGTEFRDPSEVNSKIERILRG